MNIQRKEKLIIITMAIIQFISVVEFAMILPLGPDLAKALDIPLSELAYLSSVFTVMETFSSIITALFLGRFKQRSVLIVILIGMILGTLSCVLATNFATLLIGRMVAGLFGGPLASLVLAIAIESVPVEKRGYVIGYMASSFSLAIVLGAPIGLTLSFLGGWQLPFIIIAMLSIVMLIVVFFVLSYGSKDLNKASSITIKQLVSSWIQPNAMIAHISSIIGMSMTFMLMPNISGYIQYNLNYSREDLAWLYLVGGIINFLATRVAGHVVDRWNILTVTLISFFIHLLSVYNGFILFPVELPIMVIFTLYMAGNAMGGVARTSCISRIPSAEERASFMLLYGAMRCVGITLGSLFSTFVLYTNPNGQLVGMQQLGMIAIVLSFVGPLSIWVLERRLANKQP